MNASHVYHIAMALPSDERECLYDMLGKSIIKPINRRKKRKKLPDFTVDDGIKYLIRTQFKQNKY